MPADPARQPQEEADRWVLPTGDGVVTQLQIDFAFGLTIGQWLHIRIEEPFVVQTGANRIECDPGSLAGTAAFRLISLPGGGVAEWMTAPQRHEQQPLCRYLRRLRAATRRRASAPV